MYILQDLSLGAQNPEVGAGHRHSAHRMNAGVDMVAGQCAHLVVLVVARGAGLDLTLMTTHKPQLSLIESPSRHAGSPEDSSASRSTGETRSGAYRTENAALYILVCCCCETMQLCTWSAIRLPHTSACDVFRWQRRTGQDTRQ